jgi:hypothetical protein
VAFKWTEKHKSSIFEMHIPHRVLHAQAYVGYNRDWRLLSWVVSPLGGAMAGTFGLRKILESRPLRSRAGMGPALGRPMRCKACYTLTAMSVDQW